MFSLWLDLRLGSIPYENVVFRTNIKENGGMKLTETRFIKMLKSIVKKMVYVYYSYYSKKGSIRTPHRIYTCDTMVIIDQLDIVYCADPT